MQNYFNNLVGPNNLGVFEPVGPCRGESVCVKTWFCLALFSTGWDLKTNGLVTSMVIKPSYLDRFIHGGDSLYTYNNFKIFRLLRTSPHVIAQKLPKKL